MAAGLSTATTVWGHIKGLTAPELFVIALLVFAVALFAVDKVVALCRKRAELPEAGSEQEPPIPVSAPVQGAPVLIHRIDFDYLDSSSPLEHGWKVAEEKRAGILPTIAPLRDITASPRTIMSITDHGWYGLDYTLPYVSLYDRVQFTARFADGGVLYLKFRVWTPDGKAKDKWLAQLPVGGTVPHGDGSIEWRVSQPTRILPNGWILFDLSLADQVQSTFGPSACQLLGVRVRGSLAVSCIEFSGTSTPTAATTKPEDATSVPCGARSGRLAFVHSMHHPIGAGIGNKALMILIVNTVMDFMYLCRDVKANLTFTHLHTKETFTKDGWFVIFDKDKARKPVGSVSLSSNEHAWIVLHVSNVDGDYPFCGPGGAIDSLFDWTTTLDERERLSFGRWQIRIAVTSSSGDGLYREIEIQAQ
jgi:hypothetical protein